MKTTFKRILAIVLTVIMILTVMPMNVFAKETEPDVVNNTTAEIKQTNSLSKLLAESADMSQVSMDSPYYISEMTFNGSTANVRYYNEQDCWLVVAVYDEETEQMLGSETTLVYAESITADLEMSIALPKHFIAKAFLLDENNAPLCKNLVCRTYTTEYEKFAEMTVNDFDSEQVVNLDKAEDNNFVVLSDNVSTIKGTNTTNTLYSSNVDTNTYVIKNIDSNVKNLKVGDSFYLDNGDIDNFLAIKVKSISISGTTATIIADDSDTDDLFECIKIDSVASAGQGEYSGETADEAVEYLGAVDYDTEEAVFNTSSVDVDFVDFSLSHKFNIKPKEYKNKSGKVEGKFSGGVTFNAKIGFSAHFSGDYKEIAFTLDPSIKVEVKVTGKIDILEIKLGSLGCTPVPGVIIGIEPEFVVKVSGELSAKCELKFTLGVGYNSKDGFINKCKKPSLEAEVKAELTLYIGFDLQPHVALLSTHVAKVTLSGEIGVEAKATLSKSSGTSTHFCSTCIDGDLTAKGKIGVKLTFGEDTMLEKEYEATLVNLSWKLGNFYYSFSHNEFGFGSCPYNLKSFTIKVTDVKGSPIKNAIVSKNTAGDSGTYTNTNGEATITGSCGKITLTIEAYGYRKVTRNIDVSEDTEKFYIILKKSGVSTSDGTGSNDSVFTGFETTGTIINFGSYPQSKVTDTSLIKKLDNQTKQWESYEYYTGTGSWSDGKMKPSDYMQYADFKYDGSKYRAVTFSRYRPYYTGFTSSASNSLQDDNGYYTGNVYYFKYEPLQWRVLDASEGLVMCNSAIDSQAYNNYVLRSGPEWYGDSSKSYYASDYGNSSIREWLNEDFYNTAFSDGQQSRIKKNQTIDAKSTHSSSYDGTTTNDNKVFLLSYWDVLNSSYGFSSSYNSSTTRTLKGSDYAKCQGCESETSTNYLGNSWWRLRSPCGSDYAAIVIHDGYAYYNTDVSSTDGGIVPALKLEKSTIKTSSIENSIITESVDSKAESKNISVSYSACEAGGEYILLNVLGYGEDFVLTNENLLYIDQLAADENGKVSTSFIPKYNDETSTILLIGDFGNGVEAKELKETKTYIAKLMVDGKIYKEIEYNEGQKSISLPEVPKKDGYTGEWESYSLTNGGTTINAVYTPATYIATLKVDGKVYKEISYTYGQKSISLPAVPEKTGYTGAWESYSLGIGGVTINAVYTPVDNTKVKSVSLGDDFGMDYKATKKLSPAIGIVPGASYTVEYTSSDNSVATVDNNGNVYGANDWIKKTATITCTVTDEYGNKVSDTANVTVGYAWWQWIIGTILFGFIWY